jgi:hypothetical protein
MTKSEIKELAREIARELRAEDRRERATEYLGSLSVDQIIAIQKDKMRQQDRERKAAKLATQNAGGKA